MKRLFLILLVLTFVLTSARAATVNCPPNGNCAVCAPDCYSISDFPNYSNNVVCGSEIFGYSSSGGGANLICEIFYNGNGDTALNELWTTGNSSTYGVYCVAWQQMMQAKIFNSIEANCNSSYVWVTTSGCPSGYKELQGCNFGQGNNDLGTWTSTCDSYQNPVDDPMLGICSNPVDPYSGQYAGCFTCTSDTSGEKLSFFVGCNVDANNMICRQGKVEGPDYGTGSCHPEQMATCYEAVLQEVGCRNDS